MRMRRYGGLAVLFLGLCLWCGAGFAAESGPAKKAAPVKEAKESKAPDREAKAEPAKEASESRDAKPADDAKAAPDKEAKPADDAKAAKPAPAKGARRTAVAVQHDGSDNVGERFAYHLKELLAKSELFALSPRPEKKITLHLATREEFKDRPNMSSLYSVVFVYAENEKNLPYFLGSFIGLAHSATVREDAEALASKTEAVCAKFAYLFD